MLPNFQKFAGAGDGEMVVVLITDWRNRATRDRGIEAVVSDPGVLAMMAKEQIFDGSSLVADGFDVELDFN